MKSLYRSYNNRVDTAYIIRMSNNRTSSMLAERAALSCSKVGMNYEYYEAFDGTGEELVVPEHLQNQNYIKWFKVTDHHLSGSEIACALTHISLWAKCIENDQPIVVLEHDAVMVKKYETHRVLNTLCYLGCDSTPTNFLSSINKNWLFVNRAHAYALDPLAAKKLLVSVLDRGIFEAADVMMRLDDVAIHQEDVYAVNIVGPSTIQNRKQDVPLREKNGSN